MHLYNKCEIGDKNRRESNVENNMHCLTFGVHIKNPVKLSLFCFLFCMITKKKK